MSRMFFGTVILLAMTTTYSGAADTEAAGLKQGDPIGAFTVTKLAGADDDGVEVGQSLCYRCRYGSQPMVMVFTRQSQGQVTALVKELDAAVAGNDEAHLKGLVTVLGSDRAQLTQSAEKLVSDSGATHIPVVIAEDIQHGPTNYNLDDSAEVTIVLASDSQVITTFTFAGDKIEIAKVMSEVKQMLN